MAKTKATKPTKTTKLTKARPTRAKHAERSPAADAPAAVDLPASAPPPLLAAQSAASMEPPGPRPKVSLDAGKRREVIAILSVGCSRTTAAQYVGCHVSTISRTAGRDPKFDQDVRQAESLLEFKHLKNIDAAAKDARYWRAAAWALERKYPDRWGPRRPHALSAEQLAQALEQFAQLVFDEVTEAETRDRILKRLDELAAELGKAGNEAALDEA